MTGTPDAIFADVEAVYAARPDYYDPGWRLAAAEAHDREAALCHELRDAVATVSPWQYMATSVAAQHARERAAELRHTHAGIARARGGGS